MKIAKDITGQIFGRLTVLKREIIPGRPKWLCRCSCGNKITVFGGNLRRGNTTSCGCYQKEKSSDANSTHGATKGNNRSPEFQSWINMRQRCSDPNNENYKWYGGRGITVCERWQNSFKDFLEDMGPKPSPHHTIDRYPDNSGNYEPNNCRWATKEQQVANQLPRRKAA